MGPPAASMLAGYRVDLSHQEMERLVGELEAICQTLPDEGWITVEAVGNLLCHDLGYEDMDEFEEALNGTFPDFLTALPNVMTKTDEKGRLVLKLKPEPGQADWKPTKLTYKVTTRPQLWNVLLKSEHGSVEIPELEFEFNVDGKKRIDSIYNHVASAVFNLGVHVKSAGSSLSEDHKNKIVDCIMQLNALLDVETPWTLVVRDPSGLSEFKDMDQVVIEELSRTEYPGTEADGDAAPPSDPAGDVPPAA